MKKKLYKDRSTGVISGVCSGIAQYLNIDVTIVRLLYILLSIFSAAFPGIIVYIILVFVLPDKSEIGFTNYRVDDDK
jgi:phage shock protein C